MSSFMLGYKNMSMDLTKIYRKNNEFVYPTYIPFFGVNFKPNMDIYENKIKCYEKIKYYTFIINRYDKEYTKGNIILTSLLTKEKISISRELFFENYEYNFSNRLCHKKVEYYEAVKMEGIFFCKEDDNHFGYTKGYKGDYIMKKGDNYYKINNHEFKLNYVIKIDTKPIQKQIRQREEDETVLENAKKRIKLDHEKNYYKCINAICNNYCTKIHTVLENIMLYSPNYIESDDTCIIHDKNYRVTFKKDIFPYIEIYNKNDKNTRVRELNFITNKVDIYNYLFGVWSYLVKSISIIIGDSIS